MQNIDLQLFLESYPSDVSYRVCSCNELHFQLKDNEFIIVNTDPSFLPGQHWVVFYRNKEGLLEFFDSFGNLPGYYTIDFQMFVNRNCVKKYYILNPNQIQSNDSNICGLYCLLFYVSVVKNQEFNDFLLQFDNNTYLNDVHCLQKIENLFNYKFSLK